MLDEEQQCNCNELQHVRRENSALDAERHSQDKVTHQLKTRVAVLEQEILDKEQLVCKISSSLDVAQQQKEQFDERRCEMQVRFRTCLE